MRMLFRGLLIIASWLALGVVAGLVLGGCFWAVGLALEGETLAAGLRGEVADGLFKLKAMAIIGVFCGLWVGLAAGLLSLKRRKRLKSEGPTGPSRA